MLGMKRMCRVRIAKDELDKMSKEDLHRSWLLQEQYIEYIEAKLNENTDHAEIVTLRESKEKLKQQQFESSRKENILVMRLTTKEQEMQDYAAQVQELKQSQIPSISQLRSALLDPAVNLMFDRMRQEIDSLKARLEETQNELNAWKFTPDSVTGKRLMAKCRLLYQENEELGKMISSGKIAKLEGDLALQKSFSDEMKKSQTELDDFLLELDEDLEGLQSTVCFLQQQLRESKEQIEKLQKRNEELSGLSNSSTPNHHTHNENQVELKKSHAPQSCNASSNNGSDVGSSVPPISPDLNRTEGMRSPKSNRGINSGRPWSPSPPSNPIHNETTDHKHITVKIETNQNPGNSQVDRLSQKQQISPSLVKQEPTEVADNSPITVPPSHGITIPAARGSLHVEEYDSDQDTEPSRATDDSNTFINTTLADNGSQSRVAASPVTKSNLAAEKAQIPTNKRTSENCNNSPNTKGRKRTRSSKSVVAGLNEDGAREPPAVKRLRRRDIVVERDNTESGDCKRTPMEIDSVDNTDTEVEVAKALVNLAVAKKDCKEVHTNSEDLLNETLGNGELLKRKSTIEKA